MLYFRTCLHIFLNISKTVRKSAKVDGNFLKLHEICHQWASGEWEANWRDFDGTNRLLVNDPTGEVPGMSRSRKEWVRLNRFRTGVGRCNDWKFKWGQTDDPFCDCGLPQTMKHIVEECPLRSFEGGMMDLH